MLCSTGAPSQFVCALYEELSRFELNHQEGIISPHFHNFVPPRSFAARADLHYLRDNR